MKRRVKQMGAIKHHVVIARERQPRRESKKPPRMLKLSGLVLVCLLSAVAVITNINARKHQFRSDSVSYITPSNVSYLPHSNVTNEFLATFENVISSANLSLPPSFEAYVPIILENRKILCRKSHKGIISNARIYSFIEMLNAAMDTESSDIIANKYEAQSLPIILIESDASGCLHRHHPLLAKWLRLKPQLGSRYSVHDHVDLAYFPRLTWHTPSPKYGTGWCKAIGMIGYESRSILKDTCDTWLSKCTWHRTFKNHESKYPWQSKIDRAIWRGSTTGTNLLFFDLPRAKLVKKSMSRPDIIDAGFTSFVQGWEWQKLSNQTISANLIPFEDLMKYRAIIDIDGNAWSSRFTKLLCTNSVIIKVRANSDCAALYFVITLIGLQSHLPFRFISLHRLILMTLNIFMRTCSQCYSTSLRRCKI